MEDMKTVDFKAAVEESSHPGSRRFLRALVRLLQTPGAVIDSFGKNLCRQS
jgi:hypothetical protein